MSLFMRASALFFWLGALSACGSLSKLEDLKFVADAGDSPARADAALPDSAQMQNAIRSGDAAVASDGGSQPSTDDDGPCLIADGHDCDAVQQCGCDEGSTCRAAGNEERQKCELNGKSAPWSGCTAAKQCPAEQTCDRGSCRPYCAGDDDCDGGSCVPARAPDGSLSDTLNVCWKRCDPGTDEAPCAQGTACRSLKNPLGEMGSYCVAPFDPCPSVEDGVCDDPTGTGACAAGTDDNDCGCTPTLPNSACDPVTQCGCGTGATCAASLETGSLTDWSAMCYPAGTAAEGESCRFQEDCAKGLFCPSATGTCTKYCASDKDCGSGACQFMALPNGARIGSCLDACAPGDDSKCPGASICVEVDHQRYLFSSEKLFTRSGNFCLMPFSEKECVTDGVCDDPSGTRLCHAGSDDADCCKLPEGAVCDPFKQCGCPSDQGTACFMTSFDTTSACLQPGPLPLGSLCNRASDQCEAGSTCLGNICRKHCRDTPDCGGFPNTCVRAPDEAGGTRPYGVCSVSCDPTDAASCPAGTVCAIVGNTSVTACWVPENCNNGTRGGDGICDESRPGGNRICQLGTDTADCCKLSQGQVCNPETDCGCEHIPGTTCRIADGASQASCQPIHPEPLSEACESMSDPDCCNPPVVGSECDPIKQCGCEGKPNTHCQVVGSSGIGGCMPFGAVPAGSICSSYFGQCSKGYDCHDWDGVCRKACMEHTDCMLTSDGVSVDEVCLKRDGDTIGHCMVICDFDTEEPCVGGTRCARFGPDTAACYNPGGRCGVDDNGECDDTRPGGNRLCSYGSDPECD